MPVIAAPLNRTDRHAAGQARCAAVPCERHSELALPPGRDALAVLADTDHARLPSLVPTRYERMAENALTFFRGAAAVMAADLAGAPQAGLPVQACGDCHVGNFGVGRSPEGSLLFDINDFDETLPGVDFTVDLKRLCSSVALAVLEGETPDPEEARRAARGTAHAYVRRMAEMAALSPLEIWSLRTDIHALVAHVDDVALRDMIDRFVAKATADGGDDPRNYQKLAPENAALPPAQWRIADKPPNIFHWTADGSDRELLRARETFETYRETLPPERQVLVARYQLTDVVFKVVGVGSVGLVCALGLFTTPDGEPLFLQIKEAAASCLTRLLGQDAFAGHQGERVVQGQRVMQSASELFLGWTTEAATGRQFYVRHLKNKRLGEIAPLVQGHALGAYAKLCGATLARAHARSGDAAAITGYIGESGAFEDALAGFALAYARLTQRDHAALRARRAAATGPG